MMRNGGKAVGLAAACAALMLLIGNAQAAVPSPSETPAIVTVSGHTSTAVSIRTVKVGEEIPQTYAGNMIHRMSGFTFYVSCHYALQSDMGDDYCARLLEVAELAYPHWVDLVGAEPPDPETRMYLVYASTAALMNKAITNDTGLGPPAVYGGGITLYANHSAYNYPSGSLQYHQRALMIHENLHMLQMVVYGTGGLEDFTYSAEQSVYDPVKRQLTVMVFDKATINNWTDAGLSRYQAEMPSFANALRQGWNVGDGPAVALTQFFWTDPDRFLKWQIWRDEYYAGHISADTVATVTADIFGPLGALDTPWRAWLRVRHPSFHYVDWGWEQDGNTLWSYGFPQHSPFSQTDIRYKPSEKACADPYRMDYPTQPMSALVGPVRRGGDDPSVGATVDFSRNHDNGVAGLGLGVTDTTYYAVMLQKEDTLSVFSQDIADATLRLPRLDFPLPAKLVAAAKTNGDLFGLTLHIRPESLSVTVRAGISAAPETATYDIPIAPSQRERMMTHEMAVLAKSNSHGITPYIDDARAASPDLTRTAPANFWRFEGVDQIETLYKAAWHLGDKSPASLRTLKALMLRAVPADAAARSRAVAGYESHIFGVFHDVQKCDAPAAARARALADLAGLFLMTHVSRPAGVSGAPTLSVTVIDRLKTPVACTLMFPQGVADRPAPAPMMLSQYRTRTHSAGCSPDASTATILCRLQWRGETISLPVKVPLAPPT